MDERTGKIAQLLQARLGHYLADAHKAVILPDEMAAGMSATSGTETPSIDYQEASDTITVRATVWVKVNRKDY
jgi:hypothetical protein